MGLVLLDSSVLIALLNPQDLHHHTAIDSFTPQDSYLASALSLTEILPRAISAKREDDFWRHLGPLLRTIVPVDRQIATRAAQIRVSAGLKTPDAIISACALEAQAQLWTFDARLAKATKGARLLG
jgi:predicted nucleic acid-binding protein